MPKMPWEAAWQRCIECGVEVMTTKDADKALCDFHWQLKYAPEKLARCPYCHELLHDRATEWDHIIPICQGGKSAKDNLILCCAACNQEKGGRTPEQWLGYSVDFQPHTQRIML